MSRRVVITGMGVCSPIGNDLDTFAGALQNGVSGIRFQPLLSDLNFGCQIAGKPIVNDELLNKYFTSLELRDLKATGLVYGVIAGCEAWKDAGLKVDEKDEPDWDSGIIFGAGILGVDKFRDAIYKVDEQQVRRLGSTTVIQTMASGISAYLGGKLGCGNQVTTNSSACTTGTEGLMMACDRIQANKAERILVGSASDSGPYVWGGFDAMRILPRKYNTDPEKASRPMSASASGFVPGSGAGALVLESLESALSRGARIYAEILGGFVNSGGHRNGGSMTAPNSKAVQRCISKTVSNAAIMPEEIDAINGHLTATSKDPVEIHNWSVALGLKGSEFPYVNAFKGHMGHCLAAGGALESVGTILQFRDRQIYGNINCEDLHPDIGAVVDPEKVPSKSVDYPPKIIAKASFGFGDVNACVIFSQYNP
ncbi:beta-ketoacyl-[acyl-carrier-protein] synthase family protein [Lentiprolixibacter aurantiacus]|uniref:3-oxoacyl-[acyl-carrier-protein] synthase 1 n=1 Tax=Lentiprolixibacter aurantiacus TaxID=2993939 RepID=A0AAE3MLI4_9FLAO|nr:beta-ketoacyl-[acyl-carrier-protein] synthase family protein [Lentiprolixibacter aurantiacus]MCX2719644.1 beta-ketoacyl-[acyl-carrier-protein] synthase family protein [Lentiprolixibacter aurantiacus]